MYFVLYRGCPKIKELAPDKKPSFNNAGGLHPSVEDALKFS